jgi:hypothetical protein
MLTFHSGYDPAVAQADFDNEGTVSLGELATLVRPSPSFLKPF